MPLSKLRPLLCGLLGSLIAMCSVGQCNGLMLASGWTTGTQATALRWAGHSLTLALGLAFALLAARAAWQLNASTPQNSPPAELPLPLVLALLVLNSIVYTTLFSQADGEFGGEFGMDRYLLRPLLQERFGDGHLGSAWMCALSALTATWALRIRPRLGPRLLLGLLALNLVGACASANPPIHLQAQAIPQPGGYAADGFLYVRTRALVKQGFSYYEAFYASFVQRRGETRVPSNRYNWRLPTLVYLWQMLPTDGRSVLYAYWLLAAATLGAAYRTVACRVDEAFALWPAALLGGYYCYGGATIFFPFHEYWASFTVVWALWAWQTQRLTALGCLLTLAVLIREHELFWLLPLGLEIVRRRRAIPGALALPMAAFLIAYPLHYAMVDQTLGLTASTSASDWTSSNQDFVSYCARFGSFYLHRRDLLWLPLLFLGALAPLGLALRSLQARKYAELATWMPWLASQGIPLLALAWIGGGDRWYWGVLLVPQLLVGVGWAPLLLGYQAHDKAQSSALIGGAYPASAPHPEAGPLAG